MSPLARIVRGAALLCVLASAGCSTPEPPPAAPPAERWEGFPARRLSNARLEALVVPALGRLVHFSRPGEANLLWTDPAALAPDRHVIHTRYAHWGGDKTWLAPQDEWPGLLGGAWPPDPAWGDAELGPHHASPLPDGGLRVTGPVSALTGLRISRDYRLEDEELVITARVENRADAPRRVALWQVTNIPRPDRVYLIPSARSDYPRGVHIHQLPPNPYAPAPPAPVVVESAGPLLVLDPAPLAGPAKLGLDGDVAAIAAAFGDTLLLQRGQRLPGPHAHGAPGLAGVCVEYYDHGYAAKRAFAELELLGPLVTLAPGEDARHTVRWRILGPSDPGELHRLMSEPVRPPSVRPASAP